MIGLQDLIIKQNIKVTQLAKEVNMPPGRIWEWFKVNRIPKKYLKIFAEKFNVEVDYIGKKVNDIDTSKPRKRGFNNYEIRGDITAIFLERKTGEILETYIDTEDLPKLIGLNYCWHSVWKENTQSYYARATVYRGYINGKPKYDICYLQRVLLGVTDIHIIVDHEDHDTLNNCKYNLRTTNMGSNDQHRSGANKNNKSTGIRNVCWVERDNIYVVQMMKKGERFRWVFPADQFEVACDFAEKKREELFGEYAGES